MKRPNMNVIIAITFSITAISSHTVNEILYTLPVHMFCTHTHTFTYIPIWQVWSIVFMARNINVNEDRPLLDFTHTRVVHKVMKWWIWSSEWIKDVSQNGRWCAINVKNWTFYSHNYKRVGYISITTATKCKKPYKLTSVMLLQNIYL